MNDDPRARLEQRQARLRNGQQPSRQQSSRQQPSRQQPSYQQPARQQPRYQGGAQNYNRNSYGRNGQHPQRRSRSLVPVVIAGVVVLAILLGAGFAVVSCANGGGSNASQNQAQTTETQKIQVSERGEASVASDGQIVMTLGGDENTVMLAGESYIESGCHAVDKTDGNITDKVKIEGDVDADKPGEYTVTYTVSNSKGQEASATRTVKVKKSFAKNTKGVPVLMYHYVYSPKDKPAELNSNYISTKSFEKQLKWLNSEGYYFPSYQELAAYVAGKHTLPKKSVVVTFDDGELGFLKNGIPLLEKYKVPATSFIICDRDYSKKRVKKYASPYVSFQSHSYGLHNAGSVHKGHGGKIWELSKKQLVSDLKKAQKMLGTTEAVAWPYGDVSDVAPAAAKEAGVLCAFSTEYDKVKKGMNPGKLPRIRVFGGNSFSSFKSQVAG